MPPPSSWIGLKIRENYYRSNFYRWQVRMFHRKKNKIGTFWGWKPLGKRNIEPHEIFTGSYQKSALPSDLFCNSLYVLASLSLQPLVGTIWIPASTFPYLYQVHSLSTFIKNLVPLLPHFSNCSTNSCSRILKE